MLNRMFVLLFLLFFYSTNSLIGQQLCFKITNKQLDDEKIKDFYKKLEIRISYVRNLKDCDTTISFYNNNKLIELNELYFRNKIMLLKVIYDSANNNWKEKVLDKDLKKYEFNYINGILEVNGSSMIPTQKILKRISLMTGINCGIDNTFKYRLGFYNFNIAVNYLLPIKINKTQVLGSGLDMLCFTEYKFPNVENRNGILFLINILPLMLYTQLESINLQFHIACGMGFLVAKENNNYSENTNCSPMLLGDLTFANYHKKISNYVNIKYYTKNKSNKVNSTDFWMLNIGIKYSFCI